MKKYEDEEEFKDLYFDGRLENARARYCAEHPELLCEMCGELRELNEDGICFDCEEYEGF